jgi:hypothetical protein
VLIDKLKSDLAIQSAVQKVLLTRINTIEKHLVTKFDDVTLSMYYLQDEICQAKITSITIQIAKLTGEIKNEDGLH